MTNVLDISLVVEKEHAENMSVLIPKTVDVRCETKWSRALGRDCVIFDFPEIEEDSVEAWCIQAIPSALEGTEIPFDYFEVECGNSFAAKPKQDVYGLDAHLRSVSWMNDTEGWAILYDY